MEAINPLIQETVSKQFSESKTDIKELCNSQENIKTKQKMNAMLMSFWHLFFISDFLLFQKQDFRNINVGAGDLATGPYKTSLTRGDYFHKYCQEYLLCFYEVENTFKFTPPNPDYISTHTLLTNMYNDMTTSSLPVSVLEFPLFFTLQKKNFFWNRNDDRLDTYSRALMSE